MELIDNLIGRLPGSVAVNRKFAIGYMRKHGFEVMEDTKSEYPEKYNYYLRNELVAWSYDNIMYLHPVLPSLVEMGIKPQRGRTAIPFDLPCVDFYKRLRNADKALKDSLASYDELVKKSRVEKMREYFKYRNIAKQEVKEYNKLMKGLLRV